MLCISWKTLVRVAQSKRLVARNPACVHARALHVCRTVSPRQYGLTLIELLVTLSILALVAAVVAPALARRAPADDLTRAAAEVRAVLTHARQTALANGATVTLMIDPVNARYWIEPADASTEQTSDASSRLRARATDASPPDSIALPPGVQIVATAPRVQYVFSPTGPAFGEPVTLVHEGRSVRVALDPWTGSPRVQP